VLVALNTPTYRKTGRVSCGNYRLPSQNISLDADKAKRVLYVAVNAYAIYTRPGVACQWKIRGNIPKTAPAIGPRTAECPTAFGLLKKLFKRPVARPFPAPGGPVEKPSIVVIAKPPKAAVAILSNGMQGLKDCHVALRAPRSDEDRFFQHASGGDGRVPAIVGFARRLILIPR